MAEFIREQCIADSCSNWCQLLFLEAFYIKTLEPKINDGLKLSREVLLFKKFNCASIITFGNWFLCIYFEFLITQF